RRYRPAAVEGAISQLRRPGAAGWLLALVFACIVYAAFASGATSIPEDSRVQVGLAVAVVGAGIGVAAGVRGPGRSALAWAGAGLLGVFALLSAVSVVWSIAPDIGWLASNRAAEYAIAVAVVLVTAPSVRRAPQLALAALTGLAVLIALYALAGKIAP